MSKKPRNSCKYKRCINQRVIGKYCEKHHLVVSMITPVVVKGGFWDRLIRKIWGKQS